MDKQIQLTFIKSVGIVNKNIVLISILSVLPLIALRVVAQGKPALGLSAVQILAILLIKPTIYGRFYEKACGDAASGWWELFKQHWWNYTLVSFIIALPYALLFIFGINNVAAANALLYVIIEVFTIYVMPLVFITRQRIPAIASGITCLLDNVQYSIPFILIVIVMAGANSFIGNYILDTLQGSALYITNFMWSLIMYYVDIAVFTTVIMLLLEDKNLGHYVSVSARRDA
jgi:hypothetical protein